MSWVELGQGAPVSERSCPVWLPLSHDMPVAPDRRASEVLRGSTVASSQHCVPWGQPMSGVLLHSPCVQLLQLDPICLRLLGIRAHPALGG